MRILKILLLLWVAGSMASAATLLSRERYMATFSGPSKRVDLANYDTTGVWKYVHDVPAADYKGFEICWGYVPFVYRTGNAAYDHVHVSTRTQNVFLIVVKETASGKILGHHLLNLNEEYGMESPQQLTRQCEAM